MKPLGAGGGGGSPSASASVDVVARSPPGLSMFPRALPGALGGVRPMVAIRDPLRLEAAAKAPRPNMGPEELGSDRSFPWAPGTVSVPMAGDFGGGASMVTSPPLFVPPLAGLCSAGPVPWVAGFFLGVSRPIFVRSLSPIGFSGPSAAVGRHPAMFTACSVSASCRFVPGDLLIVLPARPTAYVHMDKASNASSIFPSFLPVVSFPGSSFLRSLPGL